MLVFPPAKINLGLHVLRERADGYRDIETVMVPIALHDALEAVIDPDVPDNTLEFTRTGLAVPGDPQEDLCVKAHDMLRRGRHLPGLRMHLHKAIPIGAGLGGGSSDGAHALKLISDLAHLDITRTELLTMAGELGSDCPFFLGHGAQVATGRGEVLSPIEVNLYGWWLMLINPGIHISTREVYANTPPAPVKADLVRILASTAPFEWEGRVLNALEHYVLHTYPEVTVMKTVLMNAGAAYTAMSGSGSSVFGLFRTRPMLPPLPTGHRGWVLPF